MKIFVKVKTGARENKIESIGNGHFVISVKTRPIRSRANFAVERLIADHFGIPLSQIKIISGHTAKNKIIDIFI